MTDTFLLTAGDRNSATWQKLLRHFKEELEAQRGRNDSPLSPEETAATRGKISVYKALIDLDLPQEFPQ